MKAAKAIELIIPIPAEDFLETLFTDEQGRCCVMGHLSRLTSANPKNYSHTNCRDVISHPLIGSEPIEAKMEVYNLRKNSMEFITKAYQIDYIEGVAADIAMVNNSTNINGYTERTVKERVLHLLKDMDAAGY